MKNKNYGIFFWGYLIIASWVVLLCEQSHVYYAAVVYLHALAMLLGLLPFTKWGMNRALLLVLSVFGFLFHMEIQNKAGLTVVDWGSRQIITAESGKQDTYYMERTLADGTVFKGRAKSLDYYGMFKMIDFDGRVTVKWENGDSLNGWYKDGKLKKGKLVLKQANMTYNGELSKTVGWKHPITWIVGKGILTFPDGRIEDGTWMGPEDQEHCEEFVREGFYYVYYPYGTYKECLYANGKCIRERSYEAIKGKYTNSRSVKNGYIGRFSQYKDKTGFGAYFYPNGMYYIGYFKDGKFRGEGTLYNSDKTVNRKEIWKNEDPFELLSKLPDANKADTVKIELLSEAELDKRREVEEIAKNTPAKLRLNRDEFHISMEKPTKRVISRRMTDSTHIEVKFADGTSYIFSGTCRDGKRSSGRTEYSNGDMYEGGYENDKISGYGTYVTIAQDRYKGNFENGELNGWAVHYKNRYILFYGYWKDGKSVRKAIK